MNEQMNEWWEMKSPVLQNICHDIPVRENDYRIV